MTVGVDRQTLPLEFATPPETPVSRFFSTRRADRSFPHPNPSRENTFIVATVCFRHRRVCPETRLPELTAGVDCQTAAVSGRAPPH